MDLYNFDLSIEREYNCHVIGTDEAGRGPLAGPVVAAAVRLDLSDHITGIDDSKKISSAKRTFLYDIITSRALSWAVGYTGPEEIDKINILQASLVAMRRAIDGLDTSWSMTLVDGNRMIDSIAKERQQTIVKGDSKSASIAAASIIAKVTRDRLMELYHEEYPEYGFDRHKGYATAEHKKKVLQYGMCPIHRKSFCEKILVQTELPLNIN
jgi:ribonuclease HII